MKKTIVLTILCLFMFNIYTNSYCFSAQETLDIANPDGIEEVILEDYDDEIDASEYEVDTDDMPMRKNDVKTGGAPANAEVIIVRGEVIEEIGDLKALNPNKAKKKKSKPAVDSENKVKNDKADDSQPEIPKKIQNFYKKICENETVVSITGAISIFCKSCWSAIKKFITNLPFVKKYMSDYSNTSISKSNTSSETQTSVPIGTIPIKVVKETSSMNVLQKNKDESKIIDNNKKKKLKFNPYKIPHIPM